MSGFAARVVAMIDPLARVGVGGVLLAAACMKLTQFAVVPAVGPVSGIGAFVEQIRLHGLVPTGLAIPVAVVVVALEIVLGTWLLLHVRRVAASASAIALLAAFSGYLFVAWITGAAGSCACLGDFAEQSIPGALLRKAGLAGALCAGIVLARRGGA
ncbi:MAG: MauE/DoxX family redox-associated membrane protein [Planctomycetota bacterium]